MSAAKRPHLAWTTAVVGALALLFAAAWWLWSRPASTDSTAEAAGSEAASAAAESPPPSEAARLEELRRRDLQGIEEAIDESRFTAAAEAIDRAEATYGWSEEIEEQATRLKLREAAYREALRPMEFRLVSLTTELDEVYARFYVEGTPVFATELLIPDPPSGEPKPGGLAARSHLAVLRTSLALGATLELVEPGGLFEGERVVFGPVPLSPLPNPQGRLDFTDQDAPVRSLSVEYRPSPYHVGVNVDHPAAEAPVDATDTQLLDALTEALGRDDLSTAEALLERLSSEHPGHSLEALMRDRVQARRASLAQNRTRATFTILELSVDPRIKGSEEATLWAEGGEAPSFRSSLRTTDDLILASSEDANTVPYLIPGKMDAAPEGNVLRVNARGTAPLVLVVKDTSPTFSSRVVGAVDLPVTLADLPRGTGTIVIEERPHVLVLPGSEPNRIRRVVLRWTVSR